MKLIKEKEVEEAAITHSIEVAQKETDASLSELREYAKSDFTSGVEFAEQKILPMMVEFANIAIAHNEWIDYNCRKTTEELLDIYLKTKE